MFTMFGNKKNQHSKVLEGNDYDVTLFISRAIKPLVKTYYLLFID